LWNAVKLRQRNVSFEIRRDDNGNALNRTHRRKFLYLACSNAPVAAADSLLWRETVTAARHGVQKGPAITARR
jgi:hypothetical protein